MRRGCGAALTRRSHAAHDGDEAAGRARTEPGRRLTLPGGPADDRAERVVPDRVVRRAVGGRPERDRADRRRRMEVLRLAPGARERDPRWMVDVDHAHVRVDSSGLRRSGDVSLAGVVDRRWKPERAEDRKGLRWDAGEVDRMRPGGEVVRV